MNIRSLYCPCNERTDNPLDHFEKADCGAVAPGRPERWPLEWISSILADVQGDKFHSAGKITVTRVLGCSRETIIKDFVPVVYDVRQGHSTHYGKMKHAEMKKYERPGAFAEMKLPPFDFGGETLEGITDKVSADYKVIRDWKEHSESSMGWKYKEFLKGGMDRDAAAQLNLYRIGVAKGILKVDPDSYRPKLVVVHGANAAHDGVQWYEQEVPFMTEEQILATRPLDSADNPGTQPYTVKEILGQIRGAIEKINAGADVETVIAAMPLVGAGMFAWKWNPRAKRKERLPIGEKCTKYCAVYRDCAAINMRAQAKVVCE